MTAMSPSPKDHIDLRTLVLLEKAAMRKVYLRLVPFSVVSYVLAYIDRINVSFAGLTMRSDLKMSATEFGFALGTFFLGYFLFEVPSNFVMEKVGARLWIARIMITWGMIAGAMTLVTDTTSFSIPRRVRRMLTPNPSFMDDSQSCCQENVIVCS
jgi:sugar phosphate permease